MKRYLMEITVNNLQSSKSNQNSNVENLNKYNKEQIGSLMYHSYQTSIDYNGETLDEAVSEIGKTMKGEYGELINDACLAISDSGVPVSATIISLYEGLPLITFTMSHPDYKGRGFAKQLILQSLNRLNTLGYEKCRLFVTEGNEPAFSIYKKLGFKVCDEFND